MAMSIKCSTTPSANVWSPSSSPNSGSIRSHNPNPMNIAVNGEKEVQKMDSIPMDIDNEQSSGQISDAATAEKQAITTVKKTKVLSALAATFEAAPRDSIINILDRERERTPKLRDSSTPPASDAVMALASMSSTPPNNSNASAERATPPNPPQKNEEHTVKKEDCNTVYSQEFTTSFKLPDGRTRKIITSIKVIDEEDPMKPSISQAESISTSIGLMMSTLPNLMNMYIANSSIFSPATLPVANSSSSSSSISEGRSKKSKRTSTVMMESTKRLATEKAKEITKKAPPPPPPLPKKTVPAKPRVKIMVTKMISSKLKSLLNLVYDIDIGLQTVQRQFLVDITQFQSKHITPEFLKESRKLLTDIDKALERNAPNSTLTQLSKKFYKLIPHTQEKVIDNKMLLFEKGKLLQVLTSMSYVATRERTDRKLLESLFFSINELPSDCQEYQTIVEYFNVTDKSKKLKVIDIFKLGDENSYYEAISPARLLWHGEYLANVPKILKDGLLVDELVGGRLGCGVYFSDIVSNQSMTSGYRSSDNHGIVFLGKVSLKTYFEERVENLNATSIFEGVVKGIGMLTQEPIDPIAIDKHTFVSTGKLIRSGVKSPFIESEFATRYTSDFQLQYLVRVQWDFTQDG